MIILLSDECFSQGMPNMLWYPRVRAPSEWTLTVELSLQEQVDIS